MECLVLYLMLMIPLAVVGHGPWLLVFLLVTTAIGYGVGRLKTKPDVRDGGS